MEVLNYVIRFPELFFEVAQYLDVEDLICLYSISKDVHFLINRRYTAFVLQQSTLKARESSSVFIHRCYKNLCIWDPTRRGNEGETDIRLIPSFRWLQMVLFREKVVEDILTALAEEGHLVPQGTSLSIKKLWFTLDISDNTRRTGILHNQLFWTNRDLFLVTLVFLKVDMRLTDPMAGNGETRIRKMLFNQRSLSVLAKVMRRTLLRTPFELLRMKLQYNFNPTWQIKDFVFGISPSDVGKLQYEGWGLGEDIFVPTEQLVAREAVRRGINLPAYHVDMMLYGYINKSTWRNYRPSQVDRI